MIMARSDYWPALLFASLHSQPRGNDGGENGKDLQLFKNNYSPALLFAPLHNDGGEDGKGLQVFKNDYSPTLLFASFPHNQGDDYDDNDGDHDHYDDGDHSLAVLFATLSSKSRGDDDGEYDNDFQLFATFSKGSLTCSYLCNLPPTDQVHTANTLQSRGDKLFP